MNALNTPSRRDLAAIGLIALAVLILMWPVTFGGKLLLPADMLMVMQPWQAHAQELGFDRVQTPFLDAIQQHYPWRKFAAEQLREGNIPLWNPYMFCGTPFVANNQSAVFYPETWLFTLMAPERAFGWSALLSLIMGGTFMFYFLRLLGLRRLSSVIGTLPFLFCGFLVGWMLLPTVRAVPMWLPLMLLTFEHTIRSLSRKPLWEGFPEPDGGSATGRAADVSVRMESPPTRWSTPLLWPALCALAIGLQFLAGHLHVSLFVLMIFGAYVAFRLFQEWVREERPAVLRALGHTAAAVLVGTGLAALQLLPVLELVGMNPRQESTLTFADVRNNAMVPAYLLTALVPDLFGNPADYNYWGSSLSPAAREYLETVWYFGLPAVMLLIAALAWRALRRAQTIFWAAVWLFGAGLAWGTPLYWLLFQFLPPLRQLPGVSRAVFICCFAAAVLAGMGFDALSRRAEDCAITPVRRLFDRTAMILGVLVIIIGAVAWLFTGQFESALPGLGNYTLTQVLRALILIAATAASVAIMTWECRSGQPSKNRGRALQSPPVSVPASRLTAGKALLLLVLAADLLYFAAKFVPQVSPEYLHVQSTALQALQRDDSLYRMTSLIGEGRGIDRMPPNLTMAFGLQDMLGSDSLVFEGYAKLMALVPQDQKGNPMADSPLLDLLNCKYLLTSIDLARTPGWELVTDTETNVWRNTEVLPRAFVPARVETLAADQTLARMRGQWNPAETHFVESPQPVAAQTLPGQAHLAVTDYRPNTVTAEGRLPAGHLAIVADLWYPGWHAYLDSRQTPLRRADYILRGVVPERDSRELRLVYFPAGFAAGAFLTCLAVMFIAGGLAFGRRRR